MIRTITNPLPRDCPMVSERKGGRNPAIAVVIPCYRVKKNILGVLEAIGQEVHSIYVVDDACPEGSGRHAEEGCQDPRLRVLYNPENLGVGGATMAGYRRALEEGAEIIVKIDGDGQMNPALIPQFVQPILSGQADYTKGNRFFDVEGLVQMPILRLYGNAALSFLSKLATGYWNLFDPANGYTAIHARVVEILPLPKISRGFFFESDMLFRLNTTGAVIVEIPLEAQYGDEVSNLYIRRIVGEFAVKHGRNFAKRISYNYFIRGFSIASVHLLVGLGLLVFGVVFGGYHWYLSWRSGVTASSGTVMLASLPILAGIQFLLSFISYDIQSVPRVALHTRLYEK